MEVKPKKSLGQNFLKDKNVINSIINIGNINNNNEVLEIGPGTGNLTEGIIKKNPRKLFVIEKDSNLTKLLKEKFNQDINIINEDILKFSLNDISDKKLIIYGNLPYNISTQILIKWIINYKEFLSFNKLILMFQKEVAERILAKTDSKHYGRLSIISNWKLDIKKEFDISPNCFFPKPKVESTLLSFIPKKKFFYIKNPKNLEKITRIFFSHRRKMLKKPFNQLFNGNKKILNTLKIDLNLRPQNLDFDIYYKLTSEYENLRS